MGGVLGIGSQCAFGRGDVALWGLGNSFSEIRPYQGKLRGKCNVFR